MLLLIKTAFKLCFVKKPQPAETKVPAGCVYYRPPPTPPYLRRGNGESKLFLAICSSAVYGSNTG